jgi:hypothetical protein
MVLLRSEEDVDEWCRTHNEPRGAVLPLDQAWQLSLAYFGDRLDPHYRGHSGNQFRTMFRGIGLDSGFWVSDRA